MTAGILFCGCSYSEKPPKTDGASDYYVLPSGDVPSPAELEQLNAARQEYSESINK